MENKNIKILVVDDEPDIVEILKYNLEKEKFTVFKAYSGEECITSANANNPDMIILDIRMPGMTGIEACRTLRENEKFAETPILFLTADSDEYTTMNAFDAGGSHFITKPIKPSILVSIIKELTEKEKS
ncbi:MAG: response regulator [Bacteroidetes bacterium]|nr:response regulator [Bacteroidota bacterium]MBK8362359.1 response regulator [Bacteroidota bacterium]MBK9412932.1 response regulator [Bacteroidota bacterium]MBL0032334.1 response regulator [Bacteroidota bacterium]MBP6657005.1 response regulator [Bacteroidia bacterium]